VSLPKDPPPLVYVRPPQLSYQILLDTSQCTNQVQLSGHLCSSVNHSTLIGHKCVLITWCKTVSLLPFCSEWISFLEDNSDREIGYCWKCNVHSEMMYLLLCSVYSETPSTVCHKQN
jgi:hypothetical protein